jgi:hypothetical protein
MEPTMGNNIVEPDDRIVHYFDDQGRLHSARLVREITKGKLAGWLIVATVDEQFEVNTKVVRNIEKA